MKIDCQRYIAIEGCVGVGKTTLAERLSEFRQANLVLEEFGKNPFLEDFYADPQNNVLENSLQFLLLHCHQIKKMIGLDHSETITDFSIFKDEIFAEINMINPVERMAFDEMCHLLHTKLPVPDLVIYIRGSNALITERIRQRNRLMESRTADSYFLSINRAYEKFFSDFAGSLHIIEADLYDCIKDPEFLAGLSKAIDTILADRTID